MISALSVQNFRSFKNYSLTNLRRMNVIVGRNSSGKTALLESIRLAYGATPNVAWNLNNSRQHPVGILPNPTKEQFEAPWRPLFFNFDIGKEITTEFDDSFGRKASLRMFFDPERAVLPTVAPNNQLIQQWGVPSAITPLVFDRVDLTGRASVLLATVNAPNAQFVQLQLQQGPELGRGMEFFPSSWQFNAPQAAQWFSELSINNKESEITKSINEEFNFISDLSIQSPNQVSAVYATLTHLPQKIPLSFVSSGINKLFVLMTAILTFSGGAILIDELENGLHSATLPHLWEMLFRLAVKSDTQLFMTTHSWECLRAALPLIEKNVEEFSFIRVEREGQTSVPRHFTGKDLASALEEEFDIRY